MHAIVSRLEEATRVQMISKHLTTSPNTFFSVFDVENDLQAALKAELARVYFEEFARFVFRFSDNHLDAH